MNLIPLIEQLESYITKADIKIERISKRGVDWHIDHSLKVIIACSNALIHSNADNYKSSFNFYKAVFLTLGFFPRKKVKAPKVVNNKEEINKDDLVSQLNSAKSLQIEINRLNTNCNFPHPFFGVLNLKESQRFMEVHTNHHLKIIKDILKNNK